MRSCTLISGRGRSLGVSRSVCLSLYLLHQKISQPTCLLIITTAPSPNLAPGISSLPPFIVSLAVSPSGVVAAGTADGRVWVGLGGEKPSSSSQNVSSPSNTNKKKRTRKWSGLNAEEGFETKVGEGMITGLVFTSPERVVSCALNGKMVEHELVRPNAQGQAGGLREVKEWMSESCMKLDSLTYCAASGCVAVGGLHKDAKKGALELWPLRDSEDVVGATTTVEEDGRK